MAYLIHLVEPKSWWWKMRGITDLRRYTDLELSVKTSLFLFKILFVVSSLRTKKPPTIQRRSWIDMWCGWCFVLSVELICIYYFITSNQLNDQAFNSNTFLVEFTWDLRLSQMHQKIITFLQGRILRQCFN